jgi:hypothetical protein
MVTDKPGQLVVWTDVDPAYEADFNRWYDREHMAERVGIPGFEWARRYRSAGERRRYLALYRTSSLAVFTSPTYRQAYANQTVWSKRNFARMVDPMRRVCAVEAERGDGIGGAIGVISLPAEIESRTIEHQLGNAMTIDGVLGGHLLVPDATLSTPLPNEETAGRRFDPLLVLDTTSEFAAERAAGMAARELGVPMECVVLLSLMWELRAAPAAAEEAPAAKGARA